MRKTTLVLAAVVAACHHGVSTPPAGAPAPAAPPPASAPVPAARPSSSANGAADATAALSAFLGAAKMQDIQAMSRVWGSPSGLVRDAQPWGDVEKRLIIMQCYLKHDSYKVIRESPVAGGGRTYTVQLTLGSLSRSSDFTAVPGTGGRWFLQDFQPEPLNDLCAKRGGG